MDNETQLALITILEKINAKLERIGDELCYLNENIENRRGRTDEGKSPKRKYP